MDNVQQRFARYHKLNPNIYGLFVSFAREVKTAGRSRYSIWAIANRVRWHYDVAVNSGGDLFKISNDYLSRYARLIMRQEPDLKGFFKTKPLKYGEPLAA